MGNGPEFPAVVAWRDAKLIIIDGNHRLVGARDLGYDLSTSLGNGVGAVSVPE